MSVILVFFSNKTYNEEQVKKIDAKTSKISLDINKTYQFTKNLTSNEMSENVQANELHEQEAVSDVENEGEEIKKVDDVNN